jgi:hypothetical protein
MSSPFILGCDGPKELDPMANMHYFYGQMDRFRGMGPQKPIVNSSSLSFGMPLGAVNYAKSRAEGTCDYDHQMFQDKSNPKDVRPVVDGLTTVPSSMVPHKVFVPSYQGQHDPRLTTSPCPSGSPINYFRGSISAYKPRITGIEERFLKSQETREKHAAQYARLREQGVVSGIF